MQEVVRRVLVLTGGQVKYDLTEDDLEALRQRVLNAVIPLLYEAVMEEHAGLGRGITPSEPKVHL
jgi:hypothetical protein